MNASNNLLPPFIALQTTVNIDLEYRAVERNRDIAGPGTVYEGLASTTQSLRAELKNCIMGMEVEWFRNHNVEVPIREFSWRFRGDRDSAKV